VDEHTAYSCVVGSRAYGLDGPDSDVDRRGVFVAPTPLFWGLDRPPTHVDGPEAEQFSWEVGRCCELALAANPTVLECLWSPLVERIEPVGEELLAIRGAFLSARLAETYGGYARDQLTRLDAARRRAGEVRWKQAMHMLRLLMAGAHVLRTGEILVDVSAHRDRLLAVRAGEVPWAAVQKWAAELRADLGAAAKRTALPAEPDRATVEAFLIRTRRASACL
jgi:predicted nucleotidyltransferase